MEELIIRYINKKIKENNLTISNKIKNSLMFEINKTERRLEKTLSNLNMDLMKIKDEVEEKMLSIFENMDFVKKVKLDMINTLNFKLKEILSNEEISETIIGIANDDIKANLNDNIKTVVNKILSSISKRLRQELNITKDLTYSIDSEIQHVIKNNEVSYELGKRIEKRINRLLNSIIIKEGKLILLTDKTKEEENKQLLS